MSMRGVRKPGTVTVTSAVRGLSAATRGPGQKPWNTCGAEASEPLLLRLFPLVMGVLNVTSDSFSDGGRYLDFEAAVRLGPRWWPKAPM